MMEVDIEAADATQASPHAQISSASPPAASPKQNRPEHVRTRVSRACDRCKARKSRCSGKKPCSVCTQLRLDCRYTASYRRGKPPVIEGDDSSAQSQSRMSGPEAQGSTINRILVSLHDMRHPEDPAIPSPVSLEHQHSDTNRTSISELAPRQSFNVANESVSANHSSRNSPEPLQTDRQGHFVGPASGVSFLLRVQRKLVKQLSCFSSDSSIFTFGDVPLPDFDASFFILPPRPEAQVLVDRYFEFATATHRYLHRQTVNRWLDELYDTNGSRKKDGAKSRTAVLFMVFAQATQYIKPTDETPSAEASARYFSAADHQLSSEKGEVRLTSVQARLQQCFYLLAQSRMNHCWSLFGTMAHLALALGLHRRRRIESLNGVDLIELECRKRTFWCAYSLDTYLSAALGRPRTFHDEDIDQELPVCVNDIDLDRRILSPPSGRGQSEMAGAVGHIKLLRILARVLREFYGLRPLSTENRIQLADKFTEDLDNWRTDIPLLSDNNSFDPSLLVPVFQRQRNVLNLAHWHTLLLIHRPFLLSNFASLSSHSSNASKQAYHDRFHRNVQQCLAAAIKIVSVVDELTERKQLYHAYWFTYYFAFCAVVVLYVYTIQQRNSPPDTFVSYFQDAIKCQAQISKNASDGSLVQRWGMVLEELRLEVLRQNQFLQQTHHLPDSRSGERLMSAEMALGPGLPAHLGGMHDYAHQGSLYNLASVAAAQGNAMGQEGPYHSLSMESLPGDSPSSSVAQMTGWGQFDSLATGGFGGLESFLGDGNNNWNWM